MSYKSFLSLLFDFLDRKVHNGFHRNYHRYYYYLLLLEEEPNPTSRSCHLFMQTRSRKNLITKKETNAVSIDDDDPIPNKDSKSSQKVPSSIVYTHLLTASLTFQFIKESFFQQSINSTNKSDGLSAIAPRIIQILHFLYTIAHLYLLSSLLPPIIEKLSAFSLKSFSFNGVTSLTSMRVFVAMVAFFLVLDNIRYSLLGRNEFLHHIFSRLCFFSHEVVTPFALLLLPTIVRLISASSSNASNAIRGNDNSNNSFSSNASAAELSITNSYSSSYSMYADVITIFISLFFSSLGLIRYLYMSEWHMESPLGVLVCRPHNHSSHAALVPIFINVFGLIFIPAVALFVSPTTHQLHPKTSRQLYILFYSQLVVLVGNGVIGPRKVLMALFGNGFEVLWLWSIVQCLHTN